LRKRENLIVFKVSNFFIQHQEFFLENWLLFEPLLKKWIHDLIVFVTSWRRHFHTFSWKWNFFASTLRLSSIRQKHMSIRGELSLFWWVPFTWRSFTIAPFSFDHLQISLRLLIILMNYKLVLFWCKRYYFVSSE